MAYKDRVKTFQQVEEFKRPAKTDQQCKEKFKEYCEKNGLETSTQRAASALNPLYYDYLLDYVGYNSETKEEVTRSTYMKASGRFVMLNHVLYALQQDARARIIVPPPNFLPANKPNTGVCTCEIKIETFREDIGDWSAVYWGSGSAMRDGYFYIEKAETAARARAIAAAGIGIDISGGLSTLEDAQEGVMAEEKSISGSESMMEISTMEAEIRACVSAENPMKEITAVTKKMKEASKGLNNKETSYLANVFEEVMYQINKNPSDS